MAEEVFQFRDATSGLTAFLVIDSTARGPAAGGIRTWRYDNEEAALADARRLAEAMTRKCALAGLNHGGAKLVVMDHDLLDREMAFALLGDEVERLGGRFRTAGDLGTTREDVAVMAAHTQYAHESSDGLADAVAAGVVVCMKAAADVAGKPLSRVGLQGCGFIGSAVARALPNTHLLVADVVAERAAGLGTVVEDALAADVDLVSPCAVGGVLSVDAARTMQAWAVCGGANNILAGEDAAQILVERDILCVPDAVSSAGGVIAGLADPALIDRLAETAREILEEARRTGTTPSALAASRAREIVRGA